MPRITRISTNYVSVTYSSEREIEILRCLVKGMSYKMIADACKISIDTVRAHMKNICDKLQVRSKTEGVMSAIENNAVQPSVSLPPNHNSVFRFSCSTVSYLWLPFNNKL